MVVSFLVVIGVLMPCLEGSGVLREVCIVAVALVGLGWFEKEAKDFFLFRRGEWVVEGRFYLCSAMSGCQQIKKMIGSSPKGRKRAYRILCCFEI